jgi:hypothetical protein
MRALGLRVGLAPATVALALVALAGAVVHAATWECRVTAVWSPLVLPERDYLARTAPTVRLEDDGTHAVVTRCAHHPGETGRRCERIGIDWVEQRAENASRKYYRFATHYDLQLFLDRTFVENDGLGTVYHGQCREVGQ